jgi:hypothetical protein
MSSGLPAARFRGQTWAGTPKRLSQRHSALSLPSMEDAMFKYFSIWAALVALGTGSLNAQQSNATPQRPKVTMSKMELPGADFDIIFATTECPADASCDPDTQSAPPMYGRWRTYVHLVPKGVTPVSPER